MFIFLFIKIWYLYIYLVKNDYSFDLKLIFYYIKFGSYESIKKYLVFVFNDNIVEMVKNRGSI